jgi:hypothetical protein
MSGRYRRARTFPVCAARALRCRKDGHHDKVNFARVREFLRKLCVLRWCSGQKPNLLCVFSIRPMLFAAHNVQNFVVLFFYHCTEIYGGCITRLVIRLNLSQKTTKIKAEELTGLVCCSQIALDSGRPFLRGEHVHGVARFCCKHIPQGMRVVS